MIDPLFGHVTLTSARNRGWLVECTCGFQVTTNTVVQADELLASHDRFVLAQQGVDFKEPTE